MNILRCIQNQHFNEIKAGTYNQEKVPVYYGYDTYRSDMEYMGWIVDAIKFEQPDIKLNDMYVYRHPTYHSAHYDQTFIRVLLPTTCVKAQMDRYGKL